MDSIAAKEMNYIFMKTLEFTSFGRVREGMSIVKIIIFSLYSYEFTLKVIK